MLPMQSKIHDLIHPSRGRSNIPGSCASLSEWRCGRTSHRWPVRVEHKQSKEPNRTNDNGLDACRVVLAHLSECQLTVSNTILDAVCSELVPDKTSKCDGVAEELKGRNWISEDDHGSHDQEDILEDTREGEDDGRCLADLGEY